MREPRVSFWFDLIDWLIFVFVRSEKGTVSRWIVMFSSRPKTNNFFWIFSWNLGFKKNEKGRLEKNWFFTSLGSVAPPSRSTEKTHVRYTPRSVYEKIEKSFKKRKEDGLDSNQTKAATVRFFAGYWLNSDQHFFPSFPQLFLSGNAE